MFRDPSTLSSGREAAAPHSQQTSRVGAATTGTGQPRGWHGPPPKEENQVGNPSPIRYKTNLWRRFMALPPKPDTRPRQPKLKPQPSRVFGISKPKKSSAEAQSKAEELRTMLKRSQSMPNGFGADVTVDNFEYPSNNGPVNTTDGQSTAGPSASTTADGLRASNVNANNNDAWRANNDFHAPPGFGHRSSANMTGANSVVPDRDWNTGPSIVGNGLTNMGNASVMDVSTPPTTGVRFNTAPAHGFKRQNMFEAEDLVDDEHANAKIASTWGGKGVSAHDSKRQDIFGVYGADDLDDEHVKTERASTLGAKRASNMFMKTGYDSDHEEHVKAKRASTWGGKGVSRMATNTGYDSDDEEYAMAKKATSAYYRKAMNSGYGSEDFAHTKKHPVSKGKGVSRMATGYESDSEFDSEGNPIPHEFDRNARPVPRSRPGFDIYGRPVRQGIDMYGGPITQEIDMFGNPVQQGNPYGNPIPRTLRAAKPPIIGNTKNASFADPVVTRHRGLQSPATERAKPISYVCKWETTTKEEGEFNIHDFDLADPIWKWDEKGVSKNGVYVRARSKEVREAALNPPPVRQRLRAPLYENQNRTTTSLNRPMMPTDPSAIPRAVLANHRFNRSHDGAEYEPSVPTSNSYAKSAPLKPILKSSSSHTTLKPEKPNSRFANFFSMSNRSSSNLLSKVFSSGPASKSSTSLLSHKKSKSSLGGSIAGALGGGSSGKEARDFELTPLSALLDQSFTDIQALKMIHAAQSSGVDVPGLARVNGGENLVGRDGTIIDFATVERNLALFKEYYESYMQHGGIDKDGYDNNQPTDEVYLIASVAKRSEVTRGRMGTAEGVPMTRVPDCGL